MDRAVLVAIVVGALQGVFEWLPISSEGNVAIALTWLGERPQEAVAFALFLHLGTALSATVYYRQEIAAELARARFWRPHVAFQDEYATTTFLGVATLVSGGVGIGAYLLLAELVSALTGGTIIILIGGLLVVTGVFQRLSTTLEQTPRTTPTLRDAILVGLAQGLAILPGISRSGSTTGVLLLRGYAAPASFRLSFLLSIPAAIGGGILAMFDTGLSGIAITHGLVALGTAAVVGYLTIDALMRIVHRVPFWGVCLGLGGLAVGGGVLLL